MNLVTRSPIGKCPIPVGTTVVIKDRDYLEIYEDDWPGITEEMIRHAGETAEIRQVVEILPEEVPFEVQYTLYLYQIDIAPVPKGWPPWAFERIVI